MEAVTWVCKVGATPHIPETKAVGLPYVEITTDPDNIASQRVIEANGGISVEHFIKPQQLGSQAWPAL